MYTCKTFITLFSGSVRVLNNIFVTVDSFIVLKFIDKQINFPNNFTTALFSFRVNQILTNLSTLLY